MVELNECSAGECSVSSASTTQSNQKFSILKWFKKSPKSGGQQTERTTTETDNFFTSCDSVDTFYSTTTVRSFDFHSGTIDGSEGRNFIDLSHQTPKKVGPFGAGAAKIVGKKGGNISTDVTRTLPANVLSRGRDITARYSLQNCTASFGSCGNVRHQGDLYRLGKLPEARVHVRRVHVRGKRKAPSPPVISTRPKSVCENGRAREITSVVAESCRRKRRPAPKPPEISRWSQKSSTEGMDVDKSKNGQKVIKNSSECGSSDKVVEYDFENKNSDVVGKLLQNLNNESVDASVVLVPAEIESSGADSSAKIDISQVKKELNKSQVPAKKFLDFQTISNDTLVLQGGFLLSKKDLGSTATLPFIQKTHQTSAMPRPWYKRSVFEQSQPKEDSTTGTTSKNSGNEGSLRSFFHRSSDKNADEKRKENKRKSGLSILTNISELDKEAAAIVQEEQARSRAAMLLQSSRLESIEKRSNDNEEIVQDMVTSSMENSPRKGTRALISKFNAIGNITRVSVNTNFFGKKDTNRSEAQEDIWRRKQRAAEIEKTNRDLSRYFPRRPTIAPNQQPPIINSILRQSPNPSPKLDPKVTTTRSQFLEEFKSKNTSPRSMRSVGADAGSHQDAMGSGKSLADVNSPKLLRVKVTEHRNTASEKFTGGSCSSEAIQREFSDIFEAIDMQLTPRISRADQRLKNSGTTSSQVDKVLDILVQAEKEGRKNDKVRTTVVNNNDPVKDLKEMLKEMKHSLPKRSKPKKTDECKGKENPGISNIKVLESVKVTGPPVVQFGPAKVNYQNLERSKVSSGVQTSGNVRKVESSTSELFSKEFVVPSKSGNSTGAIRKTFHLMRPREFAAIEAIMTTKNAQEDNTYANVIEKSIYANAIVLPPRNHRILPVPGDSAGGSRMRRKIPEPVDITKIHEKLTIPFADTDDEDQMAMAQKMNTLAVNRLLKRLEAAIASGNHQQAAGLAKDLAKLKIQCSVVRQRTKARNLLNVDMYIEDRLAHQGPIPLQLPVTMTVAQLKEKIFNEFQIPTNVQRWIIGRTLANDDEATLEDLQAIEGLPVFLYLAAPVFQIGDGARAPGKAPEDDKIRDLVEENENKTGETSGTNEIQEKDGEYFSKVLDESDDEIEDVSVEEEAEEEEEEEDQENEKGDEEEEEEEEKASHELKVQVEQQNGEKNHKESDNDDKGAVGVVKEIQMEQYNELMMLENCGLVPNTDSIECPICFMIYGPTEGVILRDCLHTFCRACIVNTIRYCGEAEVKCPYMDSEYTCESTLQEREIKALVDSQVYEKHLAKSISQAENNAGHHAFHCKTPDCPGWCIYDDNVNNFLCPVCNMTNCLTCRVIHSGKNCWEYQEDVRMSKETDQESKRTAAMLTEMLDRGEAMACPTCDVVLMKKWGCDWLRCSMCKTEICWVTRGPRWGPLGKGDTSGGCRCGENGVKCHPRCNYCH